MMLKQISLAVLAATFVAGSAAVALADIGQGGGFNTSAGMQNDWRATHGGDPFATAPSTNMNAYGYVPVRTPARPHQGRTNARMKQHN